MFCIYCGKRMIPDANYCLGCGGPVSGMNTESGDIKYCIRCGAQLPQKAHFCSECGYEMVRLNDVSAGQSKCSQEEQNKYDQEEWERHRQEEQERELRRQKAAAEVEIDREKEKILEIKKEIREQLETIESRIRTEEKKEKPGYCPSCGHSVGDFIYCGYCGAKVR